MMRRFHFLAVALVACVIFAMGSGSLWNEPVAEAPDHAPQSGRFIYSSSNTSSELADHCVGLSFQKCCQYERDNSPGLWIFLYAMVLLYIFLGIAIVCDDYFVPSLELLSERLDLSEDVAGATFMAAGSSAPELFTSLAGVTTESDVGVGTIVGSAVFNILVIIALTAALTPTALLLDWRPLVRDSVFYGMSIILFLIFVQDGEVQYYESIILLCLYALYILIMKFNQQLMAVMAMYGPAVKRVVPTDSENPEEKEDNDEEKLPPVRQGFEENNEMEEDDILSESISITDKGHVIKEDEKHRFKHHQKDEEKKRLSVLKRVSQMDPIEMKAVAEKQRAAEEEVTEDMCEVIANATDHEVKQLAYETEMKAHGTVSWFLFSAIYMLEKPEMDAENQGIFAKLVHAYEWSIYVLSLPLYFMMSLTIPECSRAAMEKYYVASFTLSITWIAALTIVMVVVVEKMGCILRLSVLLMGLLLVAAGTSIPDAMSSILVARDGFADMAVSNAIGSNIFDINLGLGLPFLIKAIWQSAIGEEATVNLLTELELEKYNLAKATGTYYMVPHVQFGIILLGILVVTLVTFLIFNFQLSRTLGMALFSIYICFVIYGLIKEFVCTEESGISC